MSLMSFATQIIRRLLPEYFSNKLQIFHFNEDKIIYKGMSFRQYKEQSFLDYLPDATEQQKTDLTKEMIKSYVIDKARPDEFFLFHFDHIEPQLRSTYLPQLAKDILVCSYYRKQKERPSQIMSLLRKKSSLYAYLKEFYKREALLVSSMDNLPAFTEFCSRHPRFIAKDDTGGCGVGVKMISIREKDNIKLILKELVSCGSWILEELISQHPALSEFNKASVNTVRFPSFRHGDEVTQAYPCMRFGRTGSFVDNAGQGGVFVSIDITTGMINTDAYDEYGHKYVCHPDSGKEFKGFVVPQWKDLLEVAKAAHLALPKNQVYVAFDFALSEKGWVVVEGNWGDWILQQTTLEKGFKKEFEQFIYG